jgi:hypothetical protein
LAEFIPPSESRSPTKTFAIGANGDGDQVGVTAAATIGVVETAVTAAVEAAGVEVPLLVVVEVVPAAVAGA